MQKQKASTAKIIYMALKKQGQHLHLSCSLIFLLSFVSHSQNIEWLSSAFQTAISLQFNVYETCSYLQEAVDTMVCSSYFTRGRAVNKTTILHIMPTMTAQASVILKPVNSAWSELRTVFMLTHLCGQSSCSSVFSSNVITRAGGGGRVNENGMDPIEASLPLGIGEAALPLTVSQLAQ